VACPERTAAAFARLYEECYGRVFHYIYSQVRDFELARDLTADVFVRAFARFHTLRQWDSRLPWLLVIAHNLLAAHYRRRQREQAFARSLQQYGEAEAQGTPVAEDLVLLESEMGLLSRRERQALSLRFDGGLTTAEIARLLGVREVTVRVLLYRALKKLRRALEGS
jgi:RNA polymerase sigma-70 factor (ECF subfamily)